MIKIDVLREHKENHDQVIMRIVPYKVHRPMTQARSLQRKRLDEITFRSAALIVASAKKKTTSGAGEREKLKIQEAPPLL